MHSLQVSLDRCGVAGLFKSTCELTNPLWQKACAAFVRYAPKCIRALISSSDNPNGPINVRAGKGVPVRVCLIYLQGGGPSDQAAYRFEACAQPAAG